MSLIAVFLQVNTRRYLLACNSRIRSEGEEGGEGADCADMKQTSVREHGDSLRKDHFIQQSWEYMAGQIHELKKTINESASGGLGNIKEALDWGVPLLSIGFLLSLAYDQVRLVYQYLMRLWVFE